MSIDPKKWPAWRYGPNSESDIFEKPEDVPQGWADSPAAFAQRKVDAGRKPKPHSGKKTSDIG